MRATVRPALNHFNRTLEVVHEHVTYLPASEIAASAVANKASEPRSALTG
jgi:hypothetical protein